MRNTWGETFRLSWNAMQSISAVDGKTAKDVRQNTKWRRFTVNKWFLNNMSEKEQIMDFIDQVLLDFTNEGAMDVLEDVKSEIDIRIESCEEGTYTVTSD
nr:MAG TPA: hypothetical protein [Caudoviricetes sp.]